MRLNDEFKNRIVCMTRRACMKTFRSADLIAEAGGKMVGPSEWNRHGEVIAVLTEAQAELRAALGLCGAAIEALDGEQKGEKAA